MNDPALYHGAAEDYDKYRPQYSQEVLDFIRSKFNLDKTGMLLDLGCGTGPLSIPLSQYFTKVIALDAEPEMLRIAKEKAGTLGIANIEWIEKEQKIFSRQKINLD